MEAALKEAIRKLCQARRELRDARQHLAFTMAKPGVAADEVDQALRLEVERRVTLESVATLVCLEMGEEMEWEASRG